MTGRPVLFVLAGVNGAGKSSVGGYLLSRSGVEWFNPDTFARELMKTLECSQADANISAWKEGMRRLDGAIGSRRAFAFETTLGGRTVPARIASASVTHDVHMWFSGLASAEKHIARVRARVSRGGHDIPEAKIRERYITSRENVIALMPLITRLQVYDNSAEANAGGVIPDPVLIADIRGGRLVWPSDVRSLRNVPDWAKPLVQASLAHA